MSAKIIADTLGIELTEVSDNRYQAMMYKRPIYKIGKQFYTCSKSLPKQHTGNKWVKHSDQSFAAKENVTVWYCA